MAVTRGVVAGLVAASLLYGAAWSGRPGAVWQSRSMIMEGALVLALLALWTCLTAAAALLGRYLARRWDAPEGASNASYVIGVMGAWVVLAFGHHFSLGRVPAADAWLAVGARLSGCLASGGLLGLVGLWLSGKVLPASRKQRGGQQGR